MNHEVRNVPKLLMALGLICGGAAPCAFAQDAQPPELPSVAVAPAPDAASAQKDVNAGGAATAESAAAMQTPESPAGQVHSATEASDGEWPSSPIFEGPYVAPMASYVKGRDELGDAYGPGLAIGTRRGWYAIEAMGGYEKPSNDSVNRGAGWSGSVNGLVFPFKSLPNLYAIAGAGGREFTGYQVDGAKKHVSAVTGSAGAGYLWRLDFSSYEMALRTEVLYQYGRRHQQVKPPGDVNAPDNFEDVLIRIGLQLPMRKKEVSAQPSVEPVKVIEPASPADTDQDRVPDSQDQCPDTPVGVFVDQQGCPLPG